MSMFVDADDGGVVFLNGPMVGQLMHLERGAKWHQVAQWDAPEMWSKQPPTDEQMALRTINYRIERRREGRLFFGGANRRYRELRRVARMEAA